MYGVNPEGTSDGRRCDMMSQNERQYDIVSACFAHLEIFKCMVLKVVFQIV